MDNLNDNNSIKIINIVTQISNDFELNNTYLKKKYIIENIKQINNIMTSVDGYCGSFGTGYPFYALDNLTGDLPIINEQIRYNDELSIIANNSRYTVWPCLACLSENSEQMPDLKQICKPCPRIIDDLKPRKVINRLPDIDMWMVCEDREVEIAKEGLSKLFEDNDMHTTDVDPYKSIMDLYEIVDDLKNNKMPKKMLPLDIHIIEYSKFCELLENIPFALQLSLESGLVPYLPAHPISLRKTWQYDDMAYNFVFDFLYSLTPFNCNDELKEKLNNTRRIIADYFSEEQLDYFLSMVMPESVERRFETVELQKIYKRRTQSWKK